MPQQTNNKSVGNEKPKIGRILIALDKSGYKEKIIAYAITLSKSLGASVTVIHVLDKASLGVIRNMIGYYRGGKAEEYEKAVKKQAEEFLNESKVLLQKEGINTTTAVVIKSSAAEGIIDYAKDNDVDLILIGTKGITGGARFLMGGIANSVIGHAHCPVLAIR
jgi:nucleotide-binding universal stress UspA family protein